MEIITVLNVHLKVPSELSTFINSAILSQKLPTYDTNAPLLQQQLLPLLSAYANNRCYLTELYNVMYGHYYRMKCEKSKKSDQYDELKHKEYEASVEILYRSMNAIEGMYNAASRILTGLGSPDARIGRHE